MTGLAPVLRDATVTLSAVSATPRLDAELLMAHALGMDWPMMLLRQHDLVAALCGAATVALCRQL